MRSRAVGVMAWLCVATLAAVWAAAEEQKPAAKPADRPVYTMMPGHYSLGMEQVQKQLDLVPDQKEKLAAIAKKFQEDSQQAWKGQDWTKLRELPQEEQQKKYREVQEKYKKMTDDAAQQVEAVLLPHQKDAMKKIELRQRLGMLLWNPTTLEKIGFNDQQKEQLKQLREDQQKKYMQLQEEMMDKTMELLTPEQQKQLEDLSAKGFQGWAMPGQGDKAK